MACRRSSLERTSSLLKSDGYSDPSEEVMRVHTLHKVALSSHVDVYNAQEAALQPLGAEHVQMHLECDLHH